MTGDAKLGLLVGVGLVVTAALVYYRPEGVQAKIADAAIVRTSATDELYRTVQLSPPIDARQ